MEVIYNNENSLSNSDTFIEGLFDDDYLSAFSNGAAVWLVKNRNQHLGALLNSEHREFYIQILHRMLHFRREHELEPLNEDIYLAVKPALEKTSKEEYTTTLFNRNIKQLTEWQLVFERLEKERLRGYRDISRDRFRYKLSDDTISFLYWLEDRLRGLDDDMMDDAGDILDFVFSRLKELGRESTRFSSEDEDDETSRKAGRIVHLLYEVNERTNSISRNLTETSAKMESFLLIRNHTVDEAQEVIDDLKIYLSGYLSRVHNLRRKILLELNKNKKEDRFKILNDCFDIYTCELRKAPRFMRRRSSISDTPDRIVDRLSAYYRQHGQLDSLCDRVNSSAMKVWAKLSAHLRELERKNNRCEAIEKRISEMALMEENVVPIKFFQTFFASAAMLSDPNYWDEFTKADPPQPRFHTITTKTTNRAYLPIKTAKKPPAISMDDARLKELRDWVKFKFTAEQLKNGVKIDSGSFSGIEDFQKILQLGKKGILGKGKKLKKIGLKLKVKENLTVINDERRELIARETSLCKNDKKSKIEGVIK